MTSDWFFLQEQTTIRPPSVGLRSLQNTTSVLEKMEMEYKILTMMYSNVYNLV
jgi:hypothetical protein